MIKKVRRMTALFLAFLMVFSGNITAFAKTNSSTGTKNYTIAENPADLTVTEGEEAVFTVKANGSVYYVQWQVYQNRRWTNLSTWTYGSSTKLKFKADLEDNGAKVRAVVTFWNFRQATSDAATLTVLAKNSYPAQNLDAAAGDTTVAVNAPEGALPNDVKLATEKVDAEAYAAKVADFTGEENVNVALALDISFTGKNTKTEYEPNGDVTVTIADEALKGISDPVVYHIADDGTVNKVEGVVVNEDGSLTFNAGQFSVYVVIETIVPRLTVYFKNGDTEIAHMIIKEADTPEEVTTIIYDPGAGELEEGEVFKGWSTVQAYTTETDLITIADVRTAAMELATEITEDTEVVYYAGIFKTHTITYLSDDEEDPITVGTAVAEYPAYNTNDEAPYKVNMGYTVDDQHNFEGWIAADEASQGHIKNYPEGAKSETTASGTIYYYENGTNITVTGDVTFIVRAPEGNWLVFDENGKGATYTAPQFVLKGQTTKEPSTINNMSRVGYTFGGWYDTKEHAEAHAADVSVTEGAFEFGNTLSGNTSVYASWIPNTTANYTILIWKQSVSGNSYDFTASRILNGTVGQNVSSIVKVGADEEAYATINGSAVQYLGFHLERFDENVKIVPEGTSVVNVYYDRNTYVYTFEIEGSGDRYERDDENGTWGYVDGAWVELDSEVIETTTTTVYHLSQNQNHDNGYWGQGDTYTGTIYSDRNGTEATSTEYPNTYYRRQNTGSYWNPSYTYYALYWHSETIITEEKAYKYTDDEGVEHTYTGPRFTKRQVTRDWYTIKTIVALYGQSIQDNFPIQGTNGVEYPTGTRWNPQSTLTVEGVTYFTYNVVVAYVDIMTPGDMDFHHSNNPTGQGYAERTMNYWFEALEGTVDDPSDPNTTTYKGTVYVKHETVKAVYYGVTIEDYIDFIGFEHFEADKSRNGDGYYINSNGNRATEVNFYYSRLSFVINYMDGVYVSGRNDVLQTRATNPLTTSEYIDFGVGLADYDIVPTLPAGEVGYVFEGWYMDEACNREYDFEHSTMPAGGVTVYAKWRQIQYRAFLHTGLTSDDGTNLSWGVDEEGNPVNQALSFRIDHNGHLSAPTGTRDGYKFMGWYTDTAFKNVFNETAFVFNEETVTTPYDKTVTMTDPETKVNGVAIYGPWDVETAGASNSDATGWNGTERYWITKKLDLYAKWSKILDGADGIKVVYTAAGYDLNGAAVTGTNPPTDNATYLNGTDVTAGAAATAPEGYVFDHWSVETWSTAENDYQYVASREPVLPGETFQISSDDAKVVTNADGKTKTYTVQLVAVYKEKEEATPTHIPWYRNDGTEAFHIDILPDGSDDTDDSTLLINEAVDIQDAITKNYSIFLGWARVDMGSTEEAVDTFETTEANWTQDLTEDDLFLKWDAENEQYLAKDESGNFTLVAEQIAADEKTPYHAMFAVWQKTYFYLYHSSTGEVEAVEMNDSIDLRDYVEGGTLYGGYYKAYCDLTQDDFVDGVLKEGKTNYTYDGSKATYSGLKAYWKAANAITADGSAMKPEVGKTYFLKEVPDKYLTSRIQYVYDWSQDYKLNTIYLLTVVDDKLYNEVGFDLAVNGKKVATLASSFTFEQRNTGVQTTTKVTDFAGVKRGYVGYADGEFETEGGFIKADLQFTMTPYWITPDGVTMEGSARTFTTGAEGTKNTLKEVTTP